MCFLTHLNAGLCQRFREILFTVSSRQGLPYFPDQMSIKPEKGHTGKGCRFFTPGFACPRKAAFDLEILSPPCSGCPAKAIDSLLKKHEQNDPDPL
jgi:hypothetical protein